MAKIETYTDSELAYEFFERLKERGFQIELVDYSNRKEHEQDFDPTAISFNLKDSKDQTFASFDFLGGRFYRISATDSTGWHGDEVDLKKYC